MAAPVIDGTLRPSNKRYFVGLLAGGPADMAREIRAKLAESRGVLLKYHLEWFRRRGFSKTIPKDCELVIILKDMIGHPDDAAAVVKQCKARGIPFVRTQRKWSALGLALLHRGLLPRSAITAAGEIEHLTPPSVDIHTTTANAILAGASPTEAVSASPEAPPELVDTTGEAVGVKKRGRKQAESSMAPTADAPVIQEPAQAAQEPATAVQQPQEASQERTVEDYDILTGEHYQVPACDHGNPKGDCLDCLRASAAPPATQTFIVPEMPPLPAQQLQPGYDCLSYLLSARARMAACGIRSALITEGEIQIEYIKKK